MKTSAKFARIFPVATLLFAGALRAPLAQCTQGQQEMQTPQQQAQAHHHHGDIRPVEAEYPHMGRAQAKAQGALVTLEQAQKMARESNPTLRQAEAEIRAANARQQQAGMYPNPTIGYTGDEIRGGSVGGGKQEFFAQQTVVTAGKLRLGRDVLGKEAHLATIEAEEQRIRVESAVKMAFLRVLAAQELLDARRCPHQKIFVYIIDTPERAHYISNVGRETKLVHPSNVDGDAHGCIR